MTMELLAPAGSAAALRAAVQSGADAVYLGGSEFGARASAENFTDEEMKKWVDYCHIYGVAVHVTVNTLIKEKELHGLREYIKKLNSAHVDALIIQDMGVAEIVKNTCPDLVMHASTQMSVTTLEEAKRLRDFGFSRIVLARELTEKEIERIAKNSGIETEVFIHGAICQCYSGKCLMSSILGGRSGNRGRCAQPCRLPYELTRDGKNEDKGYLLSPKDMALIKDLGTLKKIGVNSLKIEGRLKRAEYVSAVVGVYRKYLDLVQRGDTKSVQKEDMQILTDAFSRGGFTDGYLKNKLGNEMMSGASPSGTGDIKYTREAIDRTRENANLRKIPVRISGTLNYGKPIKVTVTDSDGRRGFCEGTLKPEKALKVSMDSERFTGQLLKLGQTPYSCEDITVSLDEGITIPVKEINEVRRKACDALTSERIKREEGRVTDYKIPKSQRQAPDKISISVSVYTPEQREAALKHGISDISEFKPFGGTLNIYNSLAAKYFKEGNYGGKYLTLSPELNLREIDDLVSNTEIPCEVIAYGRLPLMIMKNCPVNALGKCQRGKQIYKLKDRKKEEFPLLCDGERGNCKSVLLNSKPIYMADKIEDLKGLKINGIRLLFTVENFSQCDKIIEEYKRALMGEKIEGLKDNTFTRGHFYRGVL